MTTGKFAKFNDDRSPYTLIASMREADLLKAIQDSENLMGLFKIGLMHGKQLWVFNGDIDWDFYLETGEYRAKSDENNLRESRAETRDAHYQDYLRRHPRPPIVSDVNKISAD